MTENKKIMIVEDESIVAADIKLSLQNMGYEVVKAVSSGEDAVKYAGELEPDLILMDIVLRGKLNGIEAAAQIHSSYDIPIIYLTAYADENIIDQAKITVPFGYITKPFESRELHCNIEMALYKKEIEQKLKDSQSQLSTILGSITDAVVATDLNGHVMFMNHVAEKVTGLKKDAASGKDFCKVFKIVEEDNDTEIECPAKKLLENGVPPRLISPVLITDNNMKIPLDLSIAPIMDESSNIKGVVMVLRDITDRKKMEEELKEKVEDLGKFYEMSIGRELKMKELKEELHKLKSDLDAKSSET